MLRLYTGELKTVEKVEIEVFDKPVKVYNFEVEDWHTYFVTEQGVLVHNAGQDYDGNGNTGTNGNNSDKKLLGQNGTQVSSKTTWQNGKTERIDVENPAPGEPPGQIHYHESDNTKLYYDIENKVFYNQKTGERAPSRIQKLLKNSDFLKGIKNALKILGE